MEKKTKDENDPLVCVFLFAVAMRHGATSALGKKGYSNLQSRPRLHGRSNFKYSFGNCGLPDRTGRDDAGLETWIKPARAHFQVKVILETDWLLLRECVEDDAEAFFTLNRALTETLGTRH